jgi:hypothetical protein
MKKLTFSIGHPFWPQLLTLTLTTAGFLPNTSTAQQYQKTDLVANSSQPGIVTVGPNLVNPWGISRSSTGAWWVSDEGKGVVTLYNGSGAAQSLIVTIRQSGRDPSGTPCLTRPLSRVGVSPGRDEVLSGPIAF